MTLHLFARFGQLGCGEKPSSASKPILVRVADDGESLQGAFKGISCKLELYAHSPTSLPIHSTLVSVTLVVIDMPMALLRWEDTHPCNDS